MDSIGCAGGCCNDERQCSPQKTAEKAAWSAYRRARLLRARQQDYREPVASSKSQAPDQAVKTRVTPRLGPCDRPLKFVGGQSVRRWQGSLKCKPSPPQPSIKRAWLNCLAALTLGYIVLSLISTGRQPIWSSRKTGLGTGLLFASCSLIIGDSAIEIQEVDQNQAQQQQQQQPSLPSDQQAAQREQQQVSLSEGSGGQPQEDANVILGTTNEQALQNHNPDPSSLISIEPQDEQQRVSNVRRNKPPATSNPNRMPNGPLPPLSKASAKDDITDGDQQSRASHDFELGDLSSSKESLSGVIAAPRESEGSGMEREELGKRIAGKVVDFELQPAGGHNKAKIKKKKKKHKMEHEEAFKKWDKKKKGEKKAMEEVEKKHMKKKKEEGKKKKKKWGLDVHGQKKKGSFKKKKWGQKVKKGKGVKKGKKGKKFLKDKGHKNSGFKTVYHKEEWGKSAKWHDIKREKKWDEKSKKWKKKWNKEKGKKYKGDHMKKFEKKKKEGKKYKKAKEEKFKKFKKEKFEKGKKKKMEEHKKKKEGGMKKEEKKKKKKKP